MDYHAFWADTDADEASIWHELLTTLETYPEAPIYHYGQYEARAVAVLAKRHQRTADALLGRLINLNTYVYGKVYFPIRSNRLKDIGALAGRVVAHRRGIRVGKHSYGAIAGTRATTTPTSAYCSHTTKPIAKLYGYWSTN